VLKLHVHGGERVEIYLIIHGGTKVTVKKRPGLVKPPFHDQPGTFASNSLMVFKVLTMQGLQQRSLEAKRPAIYLSIHGSDTIHGSDLG
jgi:hypothetical protein